MRSLRFVKILTIAGLALATLISVAFAAGLDAVMIPVVPGEDLGQVIHRIHPCPVKSGDPSLQRILRDNPETLGAGGTFTLAVPAVRIPQAFVESGKACALTVTSAPVPKSRQVASSPVTQDAAIPEAKKEEKPEPKKEPEKEPKKEQEVKAEHQEEHVKEAEVGLPNEIKFGTFIEFSKLDANDYGGNQALLTSKPEYGYQLEYNRWLSHDFYLGAHTRYTKAQFQELDDRELREQSTSLRSAGVTAGYVLNEGTLIFLDGSAVQIDHVTFPEDGVVYVEHVWVPKVTLGVKTELGRAGGFSFGAEMLAALDLPASGLANTSPNVSLGAFVERELNQTLSVELGAGAQYLNQGFEDATYSYVSYGADLSLGIHF